MNTNYILLDRKKKSLSPPLSASSQRLPFIAVVYICVCLQRDCRTIWLLTKIFTFLTWINLFKPPFVHNNNNTWESSRYTHTQFEYFALHIFSVLCLHFFLYWQPCNVCVCLCDTSNESIVRKKRYWGHWSVRLCVWKWVCECAFVEMCSLCLCLNDHVSIIFYTILTSLSRDAPKSRHLAMMHTHFMSIYTRSHTDRNHKYIHRTAE